MLRVLLLIFIVMSSVAFCQTDDFVCGLSSPKALKVDEFENTTNSDVKIRMDAFFVELNNDLSASGYIINYGTDGEIAKREKQLRGTIAFRKYDVLRIVFVRGGFREIIKTKLWLVPSGANPPELNEDPIVKPAVKPTLKPSVLSKPFRLEKIGEQGSERFVNWIFSELFGKLAENKNLDGYILINASEAEFTILEERISKL